MAKKQQTTEQVVRNRETATKAAIEKTPMMQIIVSPVFGGDEVLTYRLNGVTYHVKPNQLITVPRTLATVIKDQVIRKKVAMQIVKDYMLDSTNTMGRQIDIE